MALTVENLLHFTQTPLVKTNNLIPLLHDTFVALDATKYWQSIPFLRVYVEVLFGRIFPSLKNFKKNTGWCHEPQVIGSLNYGISIHIKSSTTRLIHLNAITESPQIQL